VRVCVCVVVRGGFGLHMDSVNVTEVS
jgi:hypothetical protein